MISYEGIWYIPFKKTEKDRHELVWSVIFRLSLGECLGSLWLRNRGNRLPAPLSLLSSSCLQFPILLPLWTFRIHSPKKWRIVLTAGGSHVADLARGDCGSRSQAFPNGLCEPRVYRKIFYLIFRAFFVYHLLIGSEGNKVEACRGSWGVLFLLPAPHPYWVLNDGADSPGLQWPTFCSS